MADEQARADPRVKAVACVCGVSIERDVPVAEIHEFIRDLDTVFWVDVQDPGDLGGTIALVVGWRRGWL